MRRKEITSILTVIIVMIAGLALSDTPQLLSYQGYLTDSGGQPVNDTKQMVFSIYDAEQAGIQLWSSGAVAITVENGHFSYLIGSDSGLSAECFQNPDRWLGIQILPDSEITPRARLSSVPYAYHTLMSDTAEVGGGWVVEEGRKAGDHISYPVDYTGTFVGIGTNNPTAMLEIGESVADDDLLRVGGEDLVVDNDGSVLIGSLLYIQNEDQGIIDGAISDDDVIIEDANAILGLYSNQGNSLGSGIALGEVNSGSYINKWAIIRETSTAPLGKNGLRFTFGSHQSQGANPVFMRIDSIGNIGMGVEDPENHRLYVTSDSGGDAGSTVLIKNTNTTNGIALTCRNESSDPTCVIANHGTGIIFRCDRWIPTWRPVLTVYNDGTTEVDVLQISGGSDLAEPFEITDNKVLPKGALVVIDDENPGKLKLSYCAYDTRVAGIISGAGGVKPGLTLNQEDMFAGGQNVAIGGRVYCLADASFGPIKSGDMLTTSATPGHAMRATDREKAYGAVIGKAMTSLEEGQGLVLVLVSLQ